MASAGPLLTFRPSGGSIDIAATPCWPERQDSILITKGAFRKGWPASARGKDIQVKPLLHIKLEGALGADVAPGCDSSARRVAGAASTLLWSRIMRLPGSPDRSYLSVRLDLPRFSGEALAHSAAC